MCNKLALEREWMNMSCHWGASPEIATKWMSDLCARYQQGNRHYHTLGHIQHVLTLANTCREHLDSWNAVFFAAWFHDAIQQVGCDNEWESAELAKQALAELLVPEEIICRTEILILATKHHQAENRSDAAYFIDCDLSILGSENDVYQAYQDDCRKEYHVPDAVYRLGRSQFLESTLAKQRIFQTDFFRSKYEEQARRNITRELGFLKEL